MKELLERLGRGELSEVKGDVVAEIRITRTKAKEGEDPVYIAEMVKPKRVGLGVSDYQMSNYGWSALDKMAKNWRKAGFLD